MRKNTGFWLLPFLVGLGGCAPSASAAPATPQSVTGPITLRVDARDVPQMMLHAKVTLPVRPGALTLVYPKWIPGTHGPTGIVADISGLRISAGGKPLAWKRDAEETSEFSVTVPAGSRSVEVELDVVVATRWAATADLSDVNWNRVLLYPKGARAHDLQIDASLQIPAGWHYATALQPSSESGGAIAFKSTSLETLVDSPVVMGRYGRSIDLGTALGASHSLEVVAETKDALEANDKQIAFYRRLVVEAAALFGARHYDKYTFLYMLSSGAEGRASGLEHHASSENLSASTVFTKEDTFRADRELLPHEFSHSWCGKYRRPKGLATANYQQPMHDELLWVYEGLTNYFGWLLASRAGLQSVQDAKDDLAITAASLDAIPGRKWRPLVDTTYTPAFGQEPNRPWYSLQRGQDYYPEGTLIWLDADVTIRQKSGGQRSLDDFARAFFGGANTGAEVKTYELTDVIEALGKVVAYDWKGFFEQRVRDVAPRAPIGGIEGAGYKLSYQDKPSDLQSLHARIGHTTNERYTLGLAANDKGVVTDLYLDGAAARAGLLPGATLVAVNGRKYDGDVLHKAIADSKAAPAPIEIIFEKDGFYRTSRVTWNQGARYPHVERDPSKPDLLAAILAPRAAAK